METIVNKEPPDKRTRPDRAAKIKDRKNGEENVVKCTLSRIIADKDNKDVITKVIKERVDSVSKRTYLAGVAVNRILKEVFEGVPDAQLHTVSVPSVDQNFIRQLMVGSRQAHMETRDATVTTTIGLGRRLRGARAEKKKISIKDDGTAIKKQTKTLREFSESDPNVVIPVSPGARPRSCVMYLMGDIHFSFDNMCPPSKCVPKKGCVDIGRFLHNVTSEPALRAISLETDVFMEVPFGDIMKKKKNQTKGDSSDPHIKDFGERAGILGWMYKHFSNRLYAHGRSSTRLGRFHFVDVRTNTGSTGMPSTTTDFLRSAPTVADAYKLMYRILIDDPVRSKVAKQFHKLKGSPYQLRLAEHIKTSVEHIINDIRKSYTHNTPAKKESSFDNIFFYKRN
eukprot:gene27838-biopygen5241